MTEKKDVLKRAIQTGVVATMIITGVEAWENSEIPPIHIEFPGVRTGRIIHQDRHTNPNDVSSWCLYPGQKHIEDVNQPKNNFGTGGKGYNKIVCDRENPPQSYRHTMVRY